MVSRNVSFSKSLLNIRKESQAPMSDGPNNIEDATRRGSLALSALSSGTVSAASGDIPEEPLPVNSAVLEDPVIKKALTRSSTTSSVEDWLGLKKSKPDLRICNLVDAQKPVARRQTFSSQGKLPRISSFRTESEFRAQKKQEANAAASTVATKHDSISDAPSTPITPPEVQPGLWAKKERPRFLRSRSKKSLASLPTTPNADVHDAHDPMSDSVGTLTTDDKSQPKSPNKINGGLLWQPRQKSRDESPRPVLAKSRRTGTFDEAVSPPSQQLPRSPGVPDFKIPDMHPTRPEYLRYPSSQISPRDDTEHGLNHHLLQFFEEGIEEQGSTKEMTLKPPEHKRRRGRATAVKSRNYLPTEARRINTPPVVKPGKGNRLMGHFWDAKVAGVEDESATMNLGQQHVHTPFPMPADTSKAARMTGTTSAPTTPIHIHTRGADWYRARADDILDEDEQVDSLEELKAMFDWDVPEHLPTSPLCPANPKHKSGGTGICVYHGRGKNKAVDLLIPEGLEK